MTKVHRFLRLGGLLSALGLAVLCAHGSPLAAQTLQDLVDELEIRFDCPGAAFASGGRFVDCGNGTVRDMNTGLIWLQDASCSELAGTNANGATDFLATARDAVNALASGMCGLTDASLPGQWRLPSIGEFCNRDSSFPGVCPAEDAVDSLVNTNFASPTLSDASGSAAYTTNGDPFTGVQLSSYWSGNGGTLTRTWVVFLSNGTVLSYLLPPNPRPDRYIWPVRR